MAASGLEERAAILVVDDDPTVRRAVRLALEGEFDTVEADRGYEALRRVRAARFDAMLLDVLLPDLDGLEVLRQVRRGDAAPPVVVVTGVTVLRTAVEAMKLGAVDYVSKPFAVDELLAAVRRAVGGARARPETPGAAAVRAPVAVIGGETPVQVGLALLLGDIAPVERFALAAPVLPTRELACAVVLAGRGIDRGAVAAILDHLAARTFVFLATSDAGQPHAGSPVHPRGILAIEDWGPLVTAVRRHLAPDAVAVGRHVGEAVAYMAARHGHPLNVGDIAAAVNVSESHLAHRFPAETGFTVRGFLRALRLQIARDMVAMGEDKLDTIARRLVFADGSHLSRALRRAAGWGSAPPWTDAPRRRA